MDLHNQNSNWVCYGSFTWIGVGSSIRGNARISWLSIHAFGVMMDINTILFPITTIGILTYSSLKITFLSYALPLFSTSLINLAFTILRKDQLDNLSNYPTKQ